jgi:8-oxo-dGTP pyrophosphatase MutT (NUDIX family)
MYKIYFRERYLLISDKDINNSGNVISFSVIPDFIRFVKNYDEDGGNKSITVLSNDPKQLFDALCKSFTYIEAAGGLVRNSKNELLLIYRYNTWDLPKGKVEKDERIDHCALREVEEECGISGHTIIKKLSSTFHTYHDKGELCIKQTFWFEMVYNGNGICTPQLEENITNVLWVAFQNLPHYYANSYHSVIDIIESLFE